MDWNAIFQNIINAGIKVLISLVIIFLSFKLINLVMRKIELKLKRNKELDKTVFSTLIYMSRIGLKVIVVVCIIGYLGIDTSGITALIASLGVGVGLAVNGALSNLAGGVLLLITRPFKVDDYIEAEGVSGTVEDIRITFTRLRTPDNKVVYIPNGQLSSETIVNYSEKPTRRLDLTFNVPYGADIPIALGVIRRVVTDNPLTLPVPVPNVRVSNYADSSIEIIARPWVRSEDYWQLKFEILETAVVELKKAGIEIPYKQIDVHLKTDAQNSEENN